jgi:hypothetical protein
MANPRHKLTDAQKVQIVKRLAAYDPPDVILRWLQDEHGITVDRTAILYYNPERYAGRRCPEHWKTLFHEMRKTIVAGWGGLGGNRCRAQDGARALARRHGARRDGQRRPQARDEGPRAGRQGDGPALRHEKAGIRPTAKRHQREITVTDYDNSAALSTKPKRRRRNNSQQMDPARAPFAAARAAPMLIVPDALKIKHAAFIGIFLGRVHGIFLARSIGAKAIKSAPKVVCKGHEHAKKVPCFGIQKPQM